MITAATSPRVIAQQRLHGREVAGLGLERVEEQRPVHRVEEVDAAHRHRADSVAVVGHLERHEAVALLAALAPVLEGHLERDLGGRGARVRVEDAREARRGDLDQPPRQLDRRPVAEAEHRAVGHPVELFAQRRVDAGVPVPVDGAPQRRHAVDVAPPVDVDQVGALAALDDHRLLVGPASLLGERVPEVSAIGGDEVHDGRAYARRRSERSAGAGAKGVIRMARL